MKGLITAAGKGSRLFPVTKAIPKPILPIANRMTLEYAFDQLKDCGVTEICIVAGENVDELKAALGNGNRFGVSLTYVIQPEPLGLAHAVSFGRDFVGSDDFVLVLGDALYGDSLRPMVEMFKQRQCANVNLVKAVKDPSRFGVANVEGDRIVKLVEKPKNPESNLAMAGSYVFGPALWDVMADLKPSGRGEYEITDAIQLLVDRGHEVLACEYHGEWFDTGTLDSFLATSAYLSRGENLISNSAVVNAEVGEQVVIGEGSVVEADSISNSVILPGSIVKVTGAIKNSLIGGEVARNSDCQDAILFGDLE